IETPCLPARTLDGVFYKTENLQNTGSFKLRGAMSKLTSLPVDQPLITASSGNHGIACSHAASRTGHDLTVVLPENVAKAKLTKIESYGVKVVLHPGDSGKAEVEARARADSDGYTYVSPYNDPDVVAGQATIGLEIAEQVPDAASIYVSMGGGGLISGIGAAIKSHNPDIRVVGVSATNSAALAASITAGQITDVEHLDTLADGCAGGVDEGAITLPLASQLVDTLIHCTEEEIAETLRLIAWEDKMLVEGAAALALAGLFKDEDRKRGEKSVVVLCGSNFDTTVIAPIVDAGA
ncbi:MAG: pyridoxal-phosphate dependent enzyme, partial [Pseudomonadota bacterium]